MSQPEPDEAAAEQIAAQPLLFEISEDQAYEYIESAPTGTCSPARGSSTNGRRFTGSSCA
jgi:hypothetical protein